MVTIPDNIAEFLGFWGFPHKGPELMSETVKLEEYNRGSSDHDKMASYQDYKGDPIIPGLCKLLLEAHRQVFWNCGSINQVYLTKYSFSVD